MGNPSDKQKQTPTSLKPPELLLGSKVHHQFKGTLKFFERKWWLLVTGSGLS